MRMAVNAIVFQNNLYINETTKNLTLISISSCLQNSWANLRTDTSINFLGRALNGLMQNGRSNSRISLFLRVVERI